MIHLRDPNTAAIQFNTLCGYFIARMAMSEKWTFDIERIDCPSCLKGMNDEITNKAKVLFKHLGT